MNATSRAIKGHANKLEAELAEVREQLLVLESELQVARSLAKEALDAEWVEAQKGWSEAIGKVITERDEARAQIAAKDAALTHIVNECSTFPIKDGLAFRVESIALNALEAK